MKNQEIENWANEQEPQKAHGITSPATSLQTNTAAGDAKMPIAQTESSGCHKAALILWGICCAMSLIGILSTLLVATSSENAYNSSPDTLVTSNIFIFYLVMLPIVWFSALICASIDKSKDCDPKRKKTRTGLGILSALLGIILIPACATIMGAHQDKTRERMNLIIGAINDANSAEEHVLTKDALLKIDMGIKLDPDRPSFVTLEEKPSGNASFCFSLSDGSTLSGKADNKSLMSGRLEYDNGLSYSRVSREEHSSCDYKMLVESQYSYDIAIKEQLQKEAAERNFTYIYCNEYPKSEYQWVCDMIEWPDAQGVRGFFLRSDVVYSYEIGADDAGFHVTDITPLQSVKNMLK